MTKYIEKKKIPSMHLDFIKARPQQLDSKFNKKQKQCKKKTEQLIKAILDGIIRKRNSIILLRKNKKQ